MIEKTIAAINTHFADIDDPLLRGASVSINDEYEGVIISSPTFPEKLYGAGSVIMPISDFSCETDLHTLEKLIFGAVNGVKLKCMLELLTKDAQLPTLNPIPPGYGE